MTFTVHLTFNGKKFTMHHVPAASASEALRKGKEALVSSKQFKDYCIEMLKTESVAPNNEIPKEVKDIFSFFK